MLNPRVSIVIALVFMAAACDEPRHRGRTLSAWMNDLEADDDYKRKTACEALGEMGATAEKAIPNLIAMLEDVNEGIQDFAATSLAKIGEKSVPELEKVLQRDEPLLRLHAATALLEINPEHVGAASALVKQVTGIGNAELAKRARDVLLKRGESAAVWIAPYLKDPYAPVRIEVLKTLGKLEGKATAVLPQIKSAIDDAELRVREEAIQTLALVGTREEVEPVLRTLLENENEDIATAAALMMKHIGAYQSASGYEGEEEEEAPAKKK